MKIVNLLILFVALTLVLGAGGSYQVRERQATKSYYSQPFEPEFKIERADVPGYSLPGLFQAEAHCISKGGSGQSRWLVRAVLRTNDKKAPRELWNSEIVTPGTLKVSNGISPIVSSNSQKLPEQSLIKQIMSMPGITSSGGAISKGGQAVPTIKSSMNWRFRRLEGDHGRQQKEAANLKMIVESVAIPVVVPKQEFGERSISVNEATHAQIAVAKRQRGAKYFRESIELKAQDDSKYHFSRDAME